MTSFLHLLPAFRHSWLIAASLCLFLSQALAHPHVFVEARSALVFDDTGKATAVQHTFRFDDAFTAFAIQGFDANGDGIYSRDELGELAQVNVESMADFGYFTFGDDTRIELDFHQPEEYFLELVTVPLEDYWVMKPEDFAAMREDIALNGGSMPADVRLLELTFTLPFQIPVPADREITLDVYDPTYYVDFRFSRADGALGVINPPGTCNVVRKEPPPLDAAAAYALAQIGPDQRELPPELQAYASTQINQMIVTCAGGAAADETLASGELPDGSRTAVASDPFAAVLNEQPNESAQPMSRTTPGMGTAASEDTTGPGVLDRWFGTIAALQSEFYQKLVGELRAFNANPNAAWILMGLSFAYGVFHAAGPGHGKAIISSYVLANNETLRRGIVLSFVSALAQAVTAILLVGGAAVLFKLTSIAIQDTARWLEIGSYLLVTLLGGWLLWQRALHPLALRLAKLVPVPGSEKLALAGGASDLGETASHRTSVHHGHTHHHKHDHSPGPDGVCSSCGHAHAPTPDMLTGRLSLSRAGSIVLAVGLRPCTGALVVLVFALSQGMILAGIGSTLAMAVGTGITVSVLAAMAVGAKGVALRLFGHGSPVAGRVSKGIEIVAALFVFLLGFTLLTAAIGWG
ncbi:hypothetical protein GCM10011316_00130 [Roseibium aquae]|uniref:EF-hand domain-containing protein n=1 Tax=Roseibium aquae TaxID=1323746 RepID=A0A916T5Y7_9HYPH|nr:DUF1007 family protein [Roseibium aquae]GGB32028.1 hypothetical protein GCM10011316_00130 [Roseibium aquae]